MIALTCLPLATMGQNKEWDNIPVPARIAPGMTWEIQEKPSDDFNYKFDAQENFAHFGEDRKWYNFYHNSWNGPGTTYWQYDHVAVDGDDLVLRASRNRSTAKLGVEGINAGCITGSNRVLYPVYVEASISVANIALASDVWLLSPDDTQEIDIIECYGGGDSGNGFFAEFIHLSHHSFIRAPFTDYQPRDRDSWWGRSDVNTWGEFSWNNGDRQYVRIGVNWVGPKHFEYYIDGEMVRILKDEAMATKNGNTWYYTYPTMTNGVLDTGGDGFQKTTRFATSSTFSMKILDDANKVSNVSVVDPYNFQGGRGFTKELDIIVNVESQDWHVEAGRTPNDELLKDPTRNQMKVDWLRVYKPVPSTDIVAVTDVTMASSLSLEIGESSTLKATVLPANASDKSLAWSSSNSNIVRVSNSGVVTAVATGRATVTVNTTDGNKQASTVVTVTPKDTGGGTTTNLALNKPARQSSNYTAKSVASMANDGSRVEKNFNHTENDTNAWWEVDLGAVSEISTIEVYNRTDCCSFRLSDFHVFVSDIPFTSESLNATLQQSSVSDFHTEGQAGSPSVITANRTGRYVRVQLAGTNYLHMSEVVVKGKEGSDNTNMGLVIEAEDFKATDGTFDDSFVPEGPGFGVKASGNRINYVNAGDWASYDINVAVSGAYAIEYLISTPSANAQIQFMVDGTLVATTNVPNNGQWEDYTPLSGGTINLTAGSHTIRIVASGSNSWQWNLDKIKLSPASSSSRLIGDNTIIEKQVSIYPNPAEDIIRFISEGDMVKSVNVYNLQGVRVMSVELDNNSLNIKSLRSGIYTLQLIGENLNEIHRIIKSN